MKITFLGTGTSQGVPVIACHCQTCQSVDVRDKRLRSSLLVEVGATVMVIDTGPDFRQQMLREGVARLDAVLLTHGHKDHVAGLDDVRAFNYLQQCPMDVFAAADVQAIVKTEFGYAFSEERYPGVPQIAQHVITDTEFFVQEVAILPIEAFHYHLKVFGYRIGEMAYLTDVSQIDALEKEKLRNLDVLIVNALRIKNHYSHYNLQQALNLIEEMQPRKAFLTHISHIMGKCEDAEKLLPENVKFAYDGLKLFI